MKKWLIRMFLSLIALLVLVGIAIVLFLKFAPTFGAATSGESLARVEASSNRSDDIFKNLVETRVKTSKPDESIPISSFLFPPKGKNPSAPLPSIRFEAAKLTPGRFVWLGHSTVIFNTGTLVVMTDPVFFRASPVPVAGNAFAVTHPTEISDLPQIDVVVISHDHYDHLDHRAIGAMHTRVKQFLVPLGVSAHLQRWGVPENKISEFDWYESTKVGDSVFTLTPSRHFSGRGLSDRFKTLWGSWVVKSPDQNVFFSGDTGYFDEFKEIGKRFGPFDIAFIENGAYNQGWSQIHMFPEEAVQVSQDLNARIFFPIHWSKFDLSLHPWQEPAERATVAAAKAGVIAATPLIGEVFSLDKIPQTRWWEMQNQ